MLQEFKAFIMRGNVLDLAVGVIIGAAFGKIVDSVVNDLIMPVVAAVTGSPNFTNLYKALGSVPADFKGPQTYETLTKAGVPVLGYGKFITVSLNFVILAFVIFCIVKMASKMRKPADAAPSGPSEDVILLREIRDLLKK